MSGITTPEDYINAGHEGLLQKARLAMQSSEFQEITTEYRRNKDLWDTKTVWAGQQVLQLAAQVDPADHASLVDDALGVIPWLQKAGTDCTANSTACRIAECP
mmetsp:Transcript_127915/g.409771  ORF Transcript_127915/g.409771 Transcript_127915/m.409771 type:complete len:103 (-) Transcript_127915:123-431(-)